MSSLLAPETPVDETTRLAAVRRSQVRETGTDAALDGLVGLAAKLCGTASAEVNLVDADDLWFCAARGMGQAGGTVPRELTFCTWTVQDPDRPLLVPDAANDPRFATNPFVLDGIIGAYAGIPIVADGQPVGTMCVHDPAPRELDAGQLEALTVLTRAAQSHLALRRHVAELSELARTDALTGAANRRAIDEVLEHEVARARRHGRPLALLLIDLDRFKAYNDAHGHPTGDVLLQRWTRAWRGLLRGTDLLGRWGGEEFCVVLPDCAPGRARAVAERLRQATPERGQGCSIGAAVWDGAETAAELVAGADAALYDAKHRGRDQVVVADR